MHLGHGYFTYLTGRDGTPHPARRRFLQELAPVRDVLGGLRVQKMACPYPPTEVATAIDGLLKTAGGD